MPRKIKKNSRKHKRGKVRTPRPYPVFNFTTKNSSLHGTIRIKNGLKINEPAGTQIDVVEELDTNDPKWRLENEEDYIFSKRFDYSVKTLLDRYEDGASNRVISSCLMMTEAAFEEYYEGIVCKLRKFMGVKL